MSSQLYIPEYQQQAVESLLAGIKTTEEEIAQLKDHLKAKKAEIKKARQSISTLTGEKPAKKQVTRRKKAAQVAA